MEQRRNKVYVSVNADHNADGTHRCRAAATKVGGTGIRYTVSICGKQTYLFDEENGKWFVEFKAI